MKRNGKEVCRFFTMLLILCFVPGLASAAQGKPLTATELAQYQGEDRQQLLEEGAKKEGTFTFYTSGVLKQSVMPVVDAFKKKYPYIKVEIWRAGSNAMVPRITEEFRAGKYAFDTVEGTQTNMMVLQKFGIIQPFYSPNTAKVEEEAVTQAADGGGPIAVAFRAMGIGIGYNTALISKDELPKTYKDLLDPKWKGKMVIVGTNTGVSWLGVIVHVLGEKLAEKLADQDITVQMVAPPTLMGMIINKEYAFSPTIFQTNVVDARLKGSKSVEWLPVEPVHTNVGQIALAKYPSHPHAAMLFIDFQLSQESGRLLNAHGYDSFRKDIAPLYRPFKKYYGVESLDEAKKIHELFKRVLLKNR